MKNRKSFIIYPLYVVGGLTAFWFFGNLMVTMRIPAEEAAISVVRKYDPRSGRLSAEVIRDTDTSRLMSVRVNDHEIARVTIRNFIGLGWQEETYEKI